MAPKSKTLKKIEKAVEKKAKPATIKKAVKEVEKKERKEFKPKEPKLWSAGGHSYGSLIGRGIGTVFGHGDAGAALGNWAHKGIKYLTGFGDYTERSEGYNKVMEEQGHPTHADAVLQGSPAKFLESINGVQISHREFLGVVNGSTGFVTSSRAINPGLGELGPWIPPIANNFEQWRPKAIVFEFRSTYSDAAVAGNLGTVMMSTTYDPARLPYTNQQQVMNSLYSISNKPSQSFYHIVECDPKQLAYQWYDVRNTTAATNQDLRLADLGFFQLSTLGQPGTGQIGELYVSYVYEFIKQIYVPSVTQQAMPLYYGTSNTFQSYSDIRNGVTAISPATLIFGVSNNLSVTPVTQTATNGFQFVADFKNFPIGWYQCVYSLSCSSLLATNWLYSMPTTSSTVFSLVSIGSSITNLTVNNGCVMAEAFAATPDVNVNPANGDYVFRFLFRVNSISPDPNAMRLILGINALSRGTDAVWQEKFMITGLPTALSSNPSKFRLDPIQEQLNDLESFEGAQREYINSMTSACKVLIDPKPALGKASSINAWPEHQSEEKEGQPMDVKIRAEYRAASQEVVSLPVSDTDEEELSRSIHLSAEAVRTLLKQGK